MPYVKRTVICGDVVEVKKMMMGRYGTRGAKRAAQTGDTDETQQEINERVAEERLRWLINANYRRGDLHVVLHYRDKPQVLRDVLRDQRLFWRRLRRWCGAAGIQLKAVFAVESKRMSNPHIHVLVGQAVPIAVIADVWGGVVPGGGVSVRLLDGRKNHAKLANYFCKESRSTMDRLRDEGVKAVRFPRSRGMVVPEPKYTATWAGSWIEPKPRKGYVLHKFDNGEHFRKGIHRAGTRRRGEDGDEASGWPWIEYFEIRAG